MKKTKSRVGKHLSGWLLNLIKFQICSFRNRSSSYNQWMRTWKTKLNLHKLKSGCSKSQKYHTWNKLLIWRGGFNLLHQGSYSICVPRYISNLFRLLECSQLLTSIKIFKKGIFKLRSNTKSYNLRDRRGISNNDMKKQHLIWP